MNIHATVRCKSIVTFGLSPRCASQSSLTELYALHVQSLMSSLTKNTCMVFDWTKQTVCAVSPNTCHLCYTLRISAIGGALSTPNCVETTQKEAPLNQNVVWIHGRGGAGNTQTQPSMAPSRASLFLEFYFGAAALAQHHRCAT